MKAPEARPLNTTVPVRQVHKEKEVFIIKPDFSKTKNGNIWNKKVW